MVQQTNISDGVSSSSRMQTLISVSNASACAPVAPRLGSASKNPSCLDVHQNKLFVNENAILLP